MPEIGVRELKARASEIIRAVRDHRAYYTVTYRGRPVAVLMPLSEVSPLVAEPGGEAETNVWPKLMRLGEEIGRGWRVSDISADLLSRMRR
jgi:prevent-host-death family protein